MERPRLLAVEENLMVRWSFARASSGFVLECRAPAFLVRACVPSVGIPTNRHALRQI
jgi:hypothetical protein